MADTTLRSRMAARWTRAEGTVSRILLLAVFAVGLVAQFVKPVGDALEGKAYIGGALLSLVGYVLYSEVQRLNAAHEAQRDATEHLRDTIRVLTDQVAELGEAQHSAAASQITPNDLAEEYRQALRDGEAVRLSVLGFTGETVAPKLKELLGDLPANARRTVSVRVLVPDFSKPIEVPGLLDEDGTAGDAAGFRAYLRVRISGFESELREMIGRMRHAAQGTLTVEFRALHMSPMLKLYLVNDDCVFEGIYDKLVRRPDEYGPVLAPGAGEGGELLDLIGHDSLLTRWNRDDGPHARKIIQRRQELFETFWKAAHPLPARLPGRRRPVQQSQD
ncbi:ATP/GTP-binding protein [Streptomyces sp. NPDC002520]